MICVAVLVARSAEGALGVFRTLLHFNRNLEHVSRQMMIFSSIFPVSLANKNETKEGELRTQQSKGNQHWMQADASQKVNSICFNCFWLRWAALNTSVDNVMLLSGCLWFWVLLKCLSPSFLLLFPLSTRTICTMSVRMSNNNNGKGLNKIETKSTYKYNTKI